MFKFSFITVLLVALGTLSLTANADPGRRNRVHVQQGDVAVEFTYLASSTKGNDITYSVVDDLTIIYPGSEVTNVAYDRDTCHILVKVGEGDQKTFTFNLTTFTSDDGQTVHLAMEGRADPRNNLRFVARAVWDKVNAAHTAPPAPRP